MLVSTSLQEDPPNGRPKTATTEEIVKKMYNIVSQNYRSKVSEISKDVNNAHFHTRVAIVTKIINLKFDLFSYPISFRQDGIKVLDHRWIKHVEVKGNYDKK